MKTSNKLLLGLFISILLVITMLNIAVYAKYKRGNFISFDTVNQKNYDEAALPPFKYIAITGMGEVHLKKAASAKIQWANKVPRSFAYKVVNDTLFISGDSLANPHELKNQKRNYQEVKLFLTGAEPVFANIGTLYVTGAKDSVTAPSWELHLADRSSLDVGQFDNEGGYINRLQLTTDHATVTFRNQVVINELKLQSRESTIENEEANIRHLYLQTDDRTKLTLFGNNLKDSIQVISKP
jgi:hypothetical protein